MKIICHVSWLMAVMYKITADSKKQLRKFIFFAIVTFYQHYVSYLQQTEIPVAVLELTQECNFPNPIHIGNN